MTGTPLVLVDGRTLTSAEMAAAIAHLPQVLSPTLWPYTRLLTADPAPDSIPHSLPAIALPDLPHLLAQADLAWVGYLPLGEGLPSIAPAESTSQAPPPCPDPPVGASPPLDDPHLNTIAGSFIAPWLPPASFPAETAQVASPAPAWIATPALLLAALPTLEHCALWGLLTLATDLERQNIAFQWRVASSTASREILLPPSRGSVLAVIPHYRCEPWLRRCLMSLVNQTHPPDAIVVVDDASPVPPIALLADFPTITLLTAPVQVGPYRLVQSVMDATLFDWYLFQDADDWSSCDRLARLLATAHQTQADLIGTQEIRTEANRGTLHPVHYPLDVNRALLEKPGHPLLHPTSMVRRRLVTAIGGFATGLRYGGDTEFLLRAAIVGRIVNLPDYGYFRQKRPHSLTTDASTGLESRDRQALLARIKARALSNRAALLSGYLPNLTPLALAPPLPLRHCAGPPLPTGTSMLQDEEA